MDSSLLSLLRPPSEKLVGEALELQGVDRGIRGVALPLAECRLGDASGLRDVDLCQAGFSQVDEDLLHVCCVHVTHDSPSFPLCIVQTHFCRVLGVYWRCRNA